MISPYNILDFMSPKMSQIVIPKLKHAHHRRATYILNKMLSVYLKSNKHIPLVWIKPCHTLFEVYHRISVSCTKHSPSSAVLLRDPFQPFLTEISSFCELRRHCFKQVSWSWDHRLIVSAGRVSRCTCDRTPCCPAGCPSDGVGMWAVWSALSLSAFVSA